MPVTLAGIQLPADISWIDEFGGFGVGQEMTPTLTGALVIEESPQTDGRPITLSSGDGSWVHRSTVEQLAVLAATPLSAGQALELVWADGRTFEVVFDRSSGRAFEAQQVYRLSAGTEQPDHPYFISISLLIKEA